ncbi:hypothetical protein Tco_0745759 [Tanacetum coccineum]
MSSPAHPDIETIPPTDRARASLPGVAPSETEEFQPPSTRSASLSSDHTPILPDRTPVSPLTNEEFEASEPSDTRITSPHSTTPSDSTTPLSPDHLLTQTAPTPTPARAFFYRRTARMDVRISPSCHLVSRPEGGELEAEGADSESKESEDEGPSSERGDCT